MGDTIGNFNSSTKNVPAVTASATESNGVHGKTSSDKDSAVFAEHTGQGIGVFASGAGGGVVGQSTGGIGVRGDSPGGFAAVHGNGGKNGVWGYTVSANDSGVFGQNDGAGNGVAGFSKGGIGVLGAGGTFAGFFQGNVQVTGDIFLPGADCAEHFDIADAQPIEPGTVVVIDAQGALRQCETAYDRKVAGVVSGAGEYRSGIVLDKQPSQQGRAPVALVGKVYCKVDARYSPIEVGDLLTSSPTAGHAMKARDPREAFGAVLGKALRPMATGCGLIPILVALQ